MFGNFGSRHKPSSFNYIPRFYDEDRERFKKRLANHQEKTLVQKPGRSLHGAFTTEHKSQQSKKLSNYAKTNIRLLLIVLMLLYCAWLIYQTDYFQDVLTDLNSFSNGR